MTIVYALKSVNRNWIYVGMTSNLEARIKRHNKGMNKSSKPYKPFILIYTRQFENRSEARKHEKFLKGGAGKKILYNLI